MKSCLQSFVIFLGVAFAALTCIGCGGSRGPELGTVSGYITLDGKPVKGANIEFNPSGGGRPSAATSDASGYYELYYSQDRNGALLGIHSVRMSTFQEGMEYGGMEGFEDVPGQKELIPNKYNTDSPLNVTVERGSNRIDLKLDSK